MLAALRSVVPQKSPARYTLINLYTTVADLTRKQWRTGAHPAPQAAQEGEEDAEEDWPKPLTEGDALPDADDADVDAALVPVPALTLGAALALPFAFAVAREAGTAEIGVGVGVGELGPGPGSSASCGSSRGTIWSGSRRYKHLSKSRALVLLYRNRIPELVGFAPACVRSD